MHNAFLLFVGIQITLLYLTLLNLHKYSRILQASYYTLTCVLTLYANHFSIMVLPSNLQPIKNSNFDKYFATFRLVNNTLKFHVKRTPILAPIRLLIAPSACQRRTGVAPDLHNGEGGSKGNVRKKLCDRRPRLELRFGYTQLLTRKQDNAFLQSAPCGMYLFKTIRGETKRKVAHKTKLSN